MHILLIFLNLSTAQVLFEGYSKILVDKKHSGFSVQRYEFDKNKKQMNAFVFTRLNPQGGNTTETLHATVKENFFPVSFFYSFKNDSGSKTIDGKIKDKKMQIKIFEKQKTKTLMLPLEKGIFLSSFLNYLMLQEGYSVGKKLSYKTLAEEEGQIVEGKTLIEKEENFEGISVFRVQNNYKHLEYSTLVSLRGEILKSYFSDSKIETQLVKTASEATKGIPYSKAELVLLFGREPLGDKNILFNPNESP